MIVTLVLTPFQLSDTENWTAAKFNLGFNPTVAGTVTFADGSADAIVTPTTKTFATFDLALDILRVAAGHGASTGQRVKVSSATTLPGGLSASYEYYLRPDVTNPATDFTLHYTLTGAQNNTDRVDVTDAGTGTHTLTYFTYATGAPFIYDAVGLTWEKGIISPENLPEFLGRSSTAPGVRGAVPPPPPGSGFDYYLGPDATWRQFPSPSDVGNNLYLNENVY